MQAKSQMKFTLDWRIVSFTKLFWYRRTRCNMAWVLGYRLFLCFILNLAFFMIWPGRGRGGLAIPIFIRPNCIVTHSLFVSLDWCDLVSYPTRWSLTLVIHILISVWATKMIFFHQNLFLFSGSHPRQLFFCKKTHSFWSSIAPTALCRKKPAYRGSPPCTIFRHPSNREI